MFKSTFSGLERYRWQYGSIFICLAVVATKICEIQQNSPKIQTYSSSRAYKVIDLGAKNHMCFHVVAHMQLPKFLLVINSNFVLSAIACLLPHSCLTPPSGGTPCNIKVIYTPLKSTFNWLQFRCLQYGSIYHLFSCCRLPNLRNSAKVRENLSL